MKAQGKEKLPEERDGTVGEVAGGDTVRYTALKSIAMFVLVSMVYIICYSGSDT